MNARTLTLSALAALCSLVGVLALACAPALAVREYFHAGTFGSAGSGNGQFNEPTGVAVNGSNEPLIQPEGGDVYVIDTGNSRVERFSATGSYLGQFNGAGSYEAEGKVQAGPATPAKSFAFSRVNDAQGLAVDSSTSALDPSAGTVYVMDFGHKVVDKFSALGKYEESQLTGTCPKPGTCTAGEVIPFPELQGVAVDPVGNVWVYTTGTTTGVNNVDEFSDTGAFVQSFSTERGTSPAFAVDASGNFYPVFSNEEIGKFEDGKKVAEFTPSGAHSVAVNPANAEVLADQGRFMELYGPITEYNPKPIQTFGTFTESRGVAVDSGNEAATVYASQRGANDVEVFNGLVFPEITLEGASGVSETGATLDGTLSLEGVALTECKFEYGTAAVSEHSVPCKQTPAEINALSKGGTVPVHVSVELASLQARASYDFRLSAANANGTRSSQVDALYTAARPTIENESNRGVGSTEATVAAQINPSGEVTSYRIEYGTSNVEESATAQVSAGAARAPQNVMVTLSNLQAGTPYRARFVASNSVGVTVGKELVFTTNKAQVVSGSGGSTCPNRTFAGFSATLPDCRAYELVSDDIDEAYVPAYGEPGPESSETAGTGEYVGTILGLFHLFGAASNGEAIFYMGGESNSGVGGNGSTSNGAGNQYVSTHSASGWKVSDISPPINGNNGGYFEVFSEDLSVQLLLASTPASEPLEAEPKLPPECVERETPGLYSRDASGLHSLVTMNHDSSTCYGRAAVISADDSHLLFEAGSPYTEEAKEAAEPAENLYDSVKSVLHQVNVLPDGEVEQSPHASFGSVRYVGEGRGGSMIGAVSSDGSRIFWTEGEGSEDIPKALYVRENDVQPQSPVAGGKCMVPGDACTVQLDVSQGGPGASGGGYFWAAVDNSNRVFFTDCSKLTADSTAHAEAGCVHKREYESTPTFTGNDLYEYDFEKPVGERLTDLTVDHNPGDVLGADVQGVIGTSEDGSYVYLVAKGVLAGSNAEGKSPVAGQPNLYVLHGGSTSFVVTLASSDNLIDHISGGTEDGDWQPTPGARTAQVSPSGDAVAFLSRLELTGYDNFGAVGFRIENRKYILSEPTEYAHIPELFVYQTSTGRIVCASCSPTGAAPSPLGLPRATLPGTTVATSWGASFVSPWLVDREGTQAYFMTAQPLVADDSNGLQDVYEWQSEGSGGCRLVSGCVSLISTAETASNAYLLEAAANGKDVFFTSRSQLTRGAGGEKLKVYDARIDGGNSEPSLSCTGTGCQGIPPAPPIFATPSSVTFNGVGNFEPSSLVVVKQRAKAKACKRGFHRRRNQCVRSKRRRSKGSGKGKSSKRRGR